MARATKRSEAHLKRVRSRIGTARRHRDAEGLDSLWERLIDLYRGKHFPSGLSPQDRVAVNIAFSTINVIGPSVAVNYPKITVNARKPELDDQARILEAVTNYWWSHYELQDEFRRAVDDFLILGFGWLKTGYRVVTEDQEVPEDEMEADYEARRAEADQFAQENPDQAWELPTDDDIRSGLAATKTVTTEDRPFMERVSPFDVYVDPEATSLRDARWVAQRVVKTLEEVRADERYDQRARRAVAPDGHLPESWVPRDSTDREGDHARVTVWEFYDLRQGTMCVFSDVGDDFLVEPTPQPYAFGHPFVMLRNYDVPDQFYPIGELEAIEPLQHELNATRTAILNDRKQNQRKYLYEPKAFDRVGVAALKSDRDNEMVPTTGAVPLGEAVVPMPRVPLDPQLYSNSEMIVGDINLITAVNEYARGQLPEIRRTATEASIIQDAANARAADKLAKVEKIIGRCAQRLVTLAQQYMTEPQVVRVIGSNGHPLWFELDPDDLQGEYDFEVVGGSTQPKNDQARRQEAMQLLQTLAPFAGAGVVNLPWLLKHVLQDGFGITNASRFMVSDQGPAMGLGEPDGGMEDEPPPEEGGMDPQGVPEGVDMPPPEDIAGIPSALTNQLAGQVGLDMQALGGM
jgi:hypothetical protein